jgi:hypothetical protein
MPGMNIRWNEKPSEEQVDNAIRAMSFWFGLKVPAQTEVNTLLRSEGIVVREGDDR